MDYQKKYLKYKTKYLELKAQLEGGSKYIAFIDNITSKKLVGYKYLNIFDKEPTKINVNPNIDSSDIRMIKYNNNNLYYVLLGKPTPTLSQLMTNFMYNIFYDYPEKQQKYNLILNEELNRTDNDTLIEVKVIEYLVYFLQFAYIRHYYNTFLKNLIDRLIKYSESKSENIFTPFIDKLNKDNQYKYLTDYLIVAIGQDNFDKILDLSDSKIKINL
jgi:hypothetical protein